MNKKPSKQAFWQNHIEQQQASGLNQQAYCEQHNLKPHQLGYWRRKLLSGEVQPDSSNGFIAIPLSGHKDDNLSVSLPNGIRVSGFCTVNDIAKLLKALA